MSWPEKLLGLDATYSDRLKVAEKPGLLRRLAGFIAHSGDSWFWLLGLAVLWFVGDAYWKQLSLIMIVGIFLTAGIVFTVKFTVRRRRPEGEWGAIYRKTDPHSFPSGHATRAVMLAVVAVGLGPGWFGVTMVIWAPLVVLARVAMGVHYLSDVIAGAVLGMGVGLIVVKFSYLLIS
jgi:membrane-associated phospholipid phosphatase